MSLPKGSAAPPKIVKELAVFNANRQSKGR